MTAEELRKAKWLVADAMATLKYALAHWPPGKGHMCRGMLAAAALAVAEVAVALETLDADA